MNALVDVDAEDAQGDANADEEEEFYTNSDLSSAYEDEIPF